jgi:WD40 repeat protein
MRCVARKHRSSKRKEPKMTSAHPKTRNFRTTILLGIVFLISLISPVKSGSVVCNQLMSLAPGIMRFLVHPTGTLLAAQTATNEGTCIAFYAFQKSNPEGRSAKLTSLCKIEGETGQGIVYNWATTKRWFAFGTPQGKIAAYEIPEYDEEEVVLPTLLGIKNKQSPIKALSWSSDGEQLAVVVEDKLTLYAINPESKKRPFKRVASTNISDEEITFLEWSHNDAFIVTGNSQELSFWRTRTASGNMKLSAYSTKELETALKSVAAGIKDIAWNKTTTPTLAVLHSRNVLHNSTQPVTVQQNLTPQSSAAISWNATHKAHMHNQQELIVTDLTGRTYMVYTLSPKSFMYDSLTHELLPPFNRGGGQQTQEKDKFRSLPAHKHNLSEATMLDLVNKLANKVPKEVI